MSYLKLLRRNALRNRFRMLLTIIGMAVAGLPSP